MRRIVAPLLAVGLLAGGLIGPAHAKKAKLRPAELKFYAVNVNEPAAESPCDLEGMVLSLSPKEGSSCGSAFAGAPHAVCNRPVPFGCGDISFVASEGLPFRLDDSRKITGSVSVGSFRPAGAPASPSAGPTTLNVMLHGKTTYGVDEVLGWVAFDYFVTPDQEVYVVPFEFHAPATLEGAVFRSLALDLWNAGGTTTFHGFYRVNDTTVTVPVLAGK